MPDAAADADCVTTDELQPPAPAAADLPPGREQALIDHLLQFISPEKQARMACVIAQRTLHLTVVLEDIFQTHNASAVMRSCECFGVQRLHVIEQQFRFSPNRDVAMGAQKWIEIKRYADARENNAMRCIETLRADGYQIAATSLRPGAIPLNQLSLEQKTALCFGTEEHGLSDTILNAADVHVTIPMYGFTQSLNISVSAALCLYDLRTRLNASEFPWQLSAAERRSAYRLWLRKSLRNPDVIERNFLNSR